MGANDLNSKQDKMFETMSVGDYQAVLEAKVKGTWNLHHASVSISEQPVDFFTMLSSVSGVIGNKGQSNYAAAGTFLDAFARYRQSLGLRAHTVDLAAVNEIGYISERGANRRLEERFNDGQFTTLDERNLRLVVTHSILQQIESPRQAWASQLVTGIAVPLENTSDLAIDPRFGHLLAIGASERKNGNESSDHDVNDAALQTLQVLHSSANATSSQKLQACVSVLTAQVERLLRLDTEVEPGKPLIAYGLDSLSAVELRGWIRARLGVDLSALDITNSPSLIAIADKVVHRLPSPV